ncbi:threonine synthase [Aliirhizobium smilacinae]|uniref:Pyridoxal-phosphate dependent enzyme n=1 Tax=Aliirhizobium smilacinae TaxID=1395944 RepID=A0A5C4XA36_9HYPH|nr:threonine synthase [Rhizobium smilacinae]TNM60336.1 pyridoxal-phosphate dependent enzyme [Rhizobium smilacinae]
MTTLGFTLTCLRCQHVVPATFPITSEGCPLCSATAPSNFKATYPIHWNLNFWHPGTVPSIWRYAAMLPISPQHQETLGEGLTPLSPLSRLGPALGVPDLMLKDESRNPTGSHKDRFSAVFISYARQRGYSTVATASSGNAGASLAAYASKSGIRCVVATTSDGPRAMSAQIDAFGATMLPFAQKQDRWRFLAKASVENGWLIASPFRAPVIGSHPVGIEGYKTLAYELVEQLGGKAPDWCVLPVCYGDALAGLWQGFVDLSGLGIINKLPRLVAAEAYGSLAQALFNGRDDVAAVPRSFETVAVSIGATQSSYQALRAIKQSDGIACPLTNLELFEMRSQLAKTEGVFAELSSVASLAAIRRLAMSGQISSGDTVIAVTTASGLKDLDFSDSASKPKVVFRSPQEAMAVL